MIKNLLDVDEDESTMERAFAEDKQANENEFEKFAAPFSEIEDEADLLEIPELKTVSLPVSEVEVNASEPINPTPPTVSFAAEPTIFESSIEKNKTGDGFLKDAYQPESSAETIRKSGMAYTAAIILFGSIVFALIIGWFADLLFGTSPWGKIVGIVLGSIIGFIQFFRITSQILKNKE